MYYNVEFVRRRRGVLLINERSESRMVEARYQDLKERNF